MPTDESHPLPSTMIVYNYYLTPGHVISTTAITLNSSIPSTDFPLRYSNSRIDPCFMIHELATRFLTYKLHLYKLNGGSGFI
ncbi:hypothetical protein HZH66_004754 [Vespula vulgaris]|uniref:Uncharacterized protein n=1 Tax=Vespula vulgaris TaxID=7454 RepID=A0A834K9B3_VESVU|nr:hypothetical protein HZH66_004754 [Vespula vulgaris]